MKKNKYVKCRACGRRIEVDFKYPSQKYLREGRCPGCLLFWPGAGHRRRMRGVAGAVEKFAALHPTRGVILYINVPAAALDEMDGCLNPLQMGDGQSLFSAEALAKEFRALSRTGGSRLDPAGPAADVIAAVSSRLEGVDDVCAYC